MDLEPTHSERFCVVVARRLGPGAWGLGHVACQVGVRREGETRRGWRTGAGGAGACVAGDGRAAGRGLGPQSRGLWGPDSSVVLVMWRRHMPH